jgi:NAD(P)-dependent dehydrogenase (short-subunit alcohol dehydrogenase family)
VKRVLITGGASGLGAALAAIYLKRGDRVLITDVAPTFDAPAGADYLQLNVTSDAHWDRARIWVEDMWGGLDLLINNAGIATSGRIDVEPMYEWERVIDINLLGVVRGCQTFVPMLKEQGSGHIANTASAAGLVHPPGSASYVAVKAAVVGVSESLAYELAPWGIAVSAICPAFFKTNLAASLKGSDELMARVAAKMVNNATLTAEEVAAKVVEGLDQRKLVVIPDKPARKAYFAKRYLRKQYDKTQYGFGARLRAMEMRTEA